MNKEEVMQEIRENISFLRKYAYEFGLSDSLETHGMMMQAQKSTFDSIDKLANACEKIGMEKAAKICDSLAWSHKNAAMLGPENNCIQCANAIRKNKE